MKGVIMAGVFGTRLRPLTFSLPKPMVPVANRPIMQRITELLKAHGITDQLALLYYQPEAIKDHFGDGSKFGVKRMWAPKATWGRPAASSWASRPSARTASWSSRPTSSPTST
jgi:mannose-1-phosphate guanylyltransferase / phosphomannomutase